jgi:hypothetical protein
VGSKVGSSIGDVGVGVSEADGLVVGVGFGASPQENGHVIDVTPTPALILHGIVKLCVPKDPSELVHLSLTA